MRFRGSTTDPVMPEPPRCAFPGCPVPGRHEHHITYEPPVTKRLCVRHHEEITIINGQQGRKYRRTLSNSHRWWAWYQWTGGKLKARRTQKALEYTGEWTSGTAQEVEVASEVTSPETKKVSPPKRMRKDKEKKQKKRSARKTKRRKLRRKPKSPKKASRR